MGKVLNILSLEMKTKAEDWESYKLITTPTIIFEADNIKTELESADFYHYPVYFKTGGYETLQQVLSKIKNHKRVTKEPLANFGCISYGECVTNIRTAADAIMIDHPELLSYGGWNLQYDDASGILTFRIENSFKLPFMNAIGEMIINKKIDAIEEQTKNMTDREKIKYVYDWIGANTVILRGTHIGANSVIAAGCVVSGNIPANTILVQKRENSLISI